MKKYNEELFKGAATYYSKYRPIYPSSLIRYLVEKFSLNGDQNLLDLGSGTGNLTIRLSDWCKHTVGIDIEPEMIEEAKRLHREVRIGQIDWFNGTLEQYKEKHNEQFSLVTIAKAFHWMDRPKVLEELYPIVTDGGGVAIIDNYNPNQPLTPWQTRMNEVIGKWYGTERRAGKGIYSHPIISHEEVIANSKFSLEIRDLPTYEITWNMESILGNLYSTSFGSKRFLENNVDLFEHELRDALLNINQSGEFKEKLTMSVKLGIKQS